MVAQCDTSFGALRVLRFGSARRAMLLVCASCASSSVVLLVGCTIAHERASVEVDAPAVGPTLELGTGDEVFEPLPRSAATLPFEAFYKGGYTLRVAARVQGVTPDDLETRFECSDPETDEACGLLYYGTHYDPPWRRSPEGDSWVLFRDDLQLLEYEREEHVGRRVHLVVQAVDRSSGLTMEDFRFVTLWDGTEGLP